MKIMIETISYVMDASLLCRFYIPLFLRWIHDIAFHNFRVWQYFEWVILRMMMLYRWIVQFLVDAGYHNPTSHITVVLVTENSRNICFSYDQCSKIWYYLYVIQFSEYITKINYLECSRLQWKNSPSPGSIST